MRSGRALFKHGPAGASVRVYLSTTWILTQCESSPTRLSWTGSPDQLHGHRVPLGVAHEANRIFQGRSRKKHLLLGVASRSPLTLLGHNVSRFQVLQECRCRDTRLKGAFTRQSCSNGVQASHCASLVVQHAPCVSPSMLCRRASVKFAVPACSDRPGLRQYGRRMQVRARSYRTQGLLVERPPQDSRAWSIASQAAANAEISSLSTQYPWAVISESDDGVRLLCKCCLEASVAKKTTSLYAKFPGLHLRDISGAKEKLYQHARQPYHIQAAENQQQTEQSKGHSNGPTDHSRADLDFAAPMVGLCFLADSCSFQSTCVTCKDSSPAAVSLLYDIDTSSCMEALVTMQCHGQIKLIPLVFLFHWHVWLQVAPSQEPQQSTQLQAPEHEVEAELDIALDAKQQEPVSAPDVLPASPSIEAMTPPGAAVGDDPDTAERLEAAALFDSTNPIPGNAQASSGG